MKGILEYVQDDIEAAKKDWTPATFEDKEENRDAVLRRLSDLGVTEQEFRDFVGENMEMFVLSAIVCGALPFGGSVIIDQVTLMSLVAEGIFIGIRAERLRVRDRQAA